MVVSSLSSSVNVGVLDLKLTRVVHTSCICRLHLLVRDPGLGVVPHYAMHLSAFANSVQCYSKEKVRLPLFPMQFRSLIIGKIPRIET